MAITLEEFKKISKIDWNQDDYELEICLHSAIEILETYTNHSLINKTIELISNGRCIEYYKYPILNIRGAEHIEYESLSVVMYAKKGDVITIDLGVSEYKVLEQVVYSLALTMYDTKEVHTTTLPLDLQLKVNQIRRDSFIS